MSMVVGFDSSKDQVLSNDKTLTYWIRASKCNIYESNIQHVAEITDETP